MIRSRSASLGQQRRLRQNTDKEGEEKEMKRIPLIKFPVRHPKPSASTPASNDVTFFKSNSASQKPKPSASGDGPSYRFKSDVPAPPTNTAVGGKASLLPKRTPVSDQEIEAIMLGGCF